jgi:hypothetical protein
MLTRRDILQELPFGNPGVLVELSGADLLAALENGVSQVENKAGRFPQVSGLRLTYNPGKPADSRVLDVQVGGKALDRTATYRVATNDFLLKGGDGYSSLSKGKVRIDASGGSLIATTVMHYITTKGSVAPQVEGRIVAHPEKAKEENEKADFCEKLGSPDNLVLRDVPSPTPGPGEVKVALRARGVSYVDVLMIAGQYQVKRDLPFIPGGEAAGVVLETGAGVEPIKPGDRVLVPGGFAEETVVKTERVTPLPASVSFETAAAFRSSYHTAYYALQRGRLKAGEVLLVHGAAGGVGLAAVDVGKLLGATVIAAASTAEKLAVVNRWGRTM